VTPARKPEAVLPLASLVGAQGLPRHIQAVLLPCAVQPALLPAPGERKCNVATDLQHVASMLLPGKPLSSVCNSS
jgi:hypothetical protein